MRLRQPRAHDHARDRRGAARCPPALGDEFFNRGYYGTVNHNAKAVYQRYLGWFDGNPANLHPLPPVEAGARYVEFMGGADEVLRQARGERSTHGDYRWVAEVVNHVVFADPDNDDGPRCSRPTRSSSSATRPSRGRGAAST